MGSSGVSGAYSEIRKSCPICEKEGRLATFNPILTRPAQLSEIPHSSGRFQQSSDILWLTDFQRTDEGPDFYPKVSDPCAKTCHVIFGGKCSLLLPVTDKPFPPSPMGQTETRRGGLGHHARRVVTSERRMEEANQRHPSMPEVWRASALRRSFPIDSESVKLGTHR